MSNPRKPFCSRASLQLKGFDAAILRNPPRIQVRWDKIARADFEGVEVIWKCFGQHEVGGGYMRLNSSQFLIYVKPDKTYIVAARAHFTANPHTGIAEHYSTEWAHEVVKISQTEEKPQYTDLGQVTVIDTPRGPAILLDELRDACG